MKHRMITLLTDFGLKDPYVAALKGVILRINPHCTLIDITHQVNPHDIEEGAFILANAYSAFPKGTIHLSVVDPGVGGSRKPILFVTKNYFFVGPDNGIFTFALQRENVKQALALTNPKYFSPRISATFHGRDIFAPVAGHLSLGMEPKAFGKEIKSWKVIPFQKPRKRSGKLTGEIIHVDTFGNLVTNIAQEQFFQLTKRLPFIITVGRESIQDLKKAYWEGKKNEPIALLGSGGFLEISIREGNAQKALRVKKGDRVVVQMGE